MGGSGGFFSDGNAHMLYPSIFSRIEDITDLAEDHAHICHDNYRPRFVKGDEGFRFRLQISVVLGLVIQEDFASGC